MRQKVTKYSIRSRSSTLTDSVYTSCLDMYSESLSLSLSVSLADFCEQGVCRNRSSFIPTIPNERQRSLSQKCEILSTVSQSPAFLWTVRTPESISVVSLGGSSTLLGQLWGDFIIIASVTTQIPPHAPMLAPTSMYHGRLAALAAAGREPHTPHAHQQMPVRVTLWKLASVCPWRRATPNNMAACENLWPVVCRTWPNGKIQLWVEMVVCVVTPYPRSIRQAASHQVTKSMTSTRALLAAGGALSPLARDHGGGGPEPLVRQAGAAKTDLTSSGHSPLTSA